MAQTPDQFAASLLAAAAEAERDASRVVKRGAQNVKDQAKRNVLMTAPVHNGGAHKAITYDDPENVGGTISSEIGYDKKIRAGRLGNLLEFGGGGDLSPPHLDLARALEAEEPRFTKAIADIGDRLL